MTRKTSRKNIEKRMRRTIECLARDDLEEALYSVSPVIDVIAKERYPDTKRVGERIKAYIFDVQHTLYLVSTQGRLRIPLGVHIAIVDDQHADQPPPNVKDFKTHAGELADYIYHNIRCAQTHDAEVHSEIIDLGRNFGIGRERFSGDGGDLAPGKFIISNATILGLFLVTLASPELRRVRIVGTLKLWDRHPIDLAQLIGNEEYLDDFLGRIFPEEKAEGSA